MAAYGCRNTMMVAHGNGMASSNAVVGVPPSHDNVLVIPNPFHCMGRAAADQAGCPRLASLGESRTAL
jgi:hypothetical protein